MTLNTATFKAFEQIQNPTLTTFSKFIAIITDPLILLTLAITTSAFLYFYPNNRQPTTDNLARKRSAILLATTSIFTGATIKILKVIFQVERPISTLIQETGYSFPSGHTAFAVVFFGLLTYIFAKPKHKIPATIISTLLITTIAFTRLYLQVHWLTDILGGLAIGSLILFLSIFIYKHISAN